MAQLLVSCVNGKRGTSTKDSSVGPRIFNVNVKESKATKGEAEIQESLVVRAFKTLS